VPIAPLCPSQPHRSARLDECRTGRSMRPALLWLLVQTMPDFAVVDWAGAAWEPSAEETCCCSDCGMPSFAMTELTLALGLSAIAARTLAT
jgi:hypothetical protein